MPVLLFVIDGHIRSPSFGVVIGEWDHPECTGFRRRTAGAIND